MLSVNACARGGRSYVVVHVLQVYYVVGSLARARPRVVSYIYACRPMPEVTRAPEGGVQASNRLLRLSSRHWQSQQPSQTVCACYHKATRGEGGARSME